MKENKYFLTAFLIIVLLLSIQKVQANRASGGGDLGCDDLTICTGSATCGGQGHETSLCQIECFDGCIISCPKMAS